MKTQTKQLADVQIPICRDEMQQSSKSIIHSRYIETFLLIRIPIIIGTYLHICTFLLICTSSSFANNLILGGTITLSGTDEINFTIKWDNSWYASTVPNNWDAVWLFVKYKDCSTTNWQHAPISTTYGDHSVTGGDGLLTHEMSGTSDRGLFIRRIATGSGNITNAESVKLKLGVSTASYNFKVFGIEMVKILNEDFQVGDGAATDRFNSITITSETALTSAVLGGTGTVANVIANYPKGWAAFYCMKYEVTSEQYMDFLNCLTYDQQATRTVIAPNQVRGNKAITGWSRHIIAIDTSGVASTTPAVYGCDLSGNVVFGESADGQNVAAHGISWADLTAYLDWACLRPMTDLEFEKICRGPLGRIAGEYPWGNVNLTTASGPSNSGQASEIASNAGYPSGLCNVWAGGACNVLRVGFAARTLAGLTRDQAGATYYGVLDMAGITYERVVGTHTGGGDTFTGVLGDGALDATGNANQANWPGTNAVGTGCRGGAFGANGGAENQTSYRGQARSDDPARTTHNSTHGGRGVR